MSSSSSKTSKSSRIKRLAPEVSNRIAAGEVIQRPSNALKELLENALDAGATNIQIQVKDGGIGCLQIQDNGSGISKEDLPLVCERFATSKLNNFDDLKTIHTFGFRGEALASMSYVAKVTITSRTPDATCAYKAHYLNGNLEPIKPGANPEPQPCAGNQGTQISITDMFYNTPLRKNALTNSNTEYLRILDIVNRYAIHCQGVGMSCRKHSATVPDLVTNSQHTTMQKIGQLYKGSLAAELVEFKTENTECKYKAKGYISNSNCSNRRAVFMLFINHRSVSSSAIKQAIEAVYAPLLIKGHHPFIYLSLEFPPHLVDVNVHPTKREVFFYDQEKVVYSLASAIQDQLETTTKSRTISACLPTRTESTLLLKPQRSQSEIHTTPGLPQTNPGRELSSSGLGLQKHKPSDFTKKSLFNTFKNDASPITKPNPPVTPSPSKKQVNRYVRTDCDLQTLHSFYSTKPDPTTSAPNNPNILPSDLPPVTSTPNRASKSAAAPDDIPAVRKRVQVRLNSVLELIDEFKLRSNPEIKKLINKHVFVGCIDTHRAAIQSEINLFMVDYSIMSKELFYQMILLEFCNFPTIEISPPLPIAKLVKFAYERDTTLPALSPDFSQQPDPFQALANFLISRREMLEEYFLITIDTQGYLTKLPVLIPKYCPPAHRLPQFLARLGSQVDWSQEKACFHTMSLELATLYQTHFHPSPSAPSLPSYYHTVTHHLFPMFKKSLFHPPATWLRPSTPSHSASSVLRPLADLPGLYKVFERC